MTEELVYSWILRGFLFLAAVTFPVLFFIEAPYGRHTGAYRGVTINATLGWIVMESPSVLVFFGCWLLGARSNDPARTALLALWGLHYVHRAYIFPFRRRGGERRMPVLVAAAALCFTMVNGYLNGRWIFTLAPATSYGPAWLVDPRFCVGAGLFLLGFAINQHADLTLFRLRAPGETGYKVPRGGLYELVSCPNYLGEIVTWIGWAVASWSLAGLCFALWTIANLLPRAVAHHRWYQEKFADYPRGRRALIPFVL